MNILVLKNPYESQPGGGGEKHTLEVTEFLRSQGHQIRFAGSCDYLLEMAQAAGFYTERIDWAGREAVAEGAIVKFAFSWPIIKKKYERYLEFQKKENRIEALYILSWNEKFLLAPIAQQLGLKLFFIEHRLLERSIKLNPFRQWYISGSKYATIIAVSEAVKKSITDLGITPSRIKVVTNGVDTDFLDKYKNSQAKGRKIIGVVSRLSSEKGLDILLRAWQKVHKENPAWSLAIAGAGPEEKKLRDLSRGLGLRNIKWLGYLDSRKKLAEFLSRLDIFALPTRSESFGLALAEAGYLEVPCISSNIGGVTEVIKDGQTGLLIPPDDIAALEITLQKFIDNPQQRRLLGVAARARVQKLFTKDRMLSEISKIITS
jgi:glycosyltransferase involved in cell wall biosynthesis